MSTTLNGAGTRTESDSMGKIEVPNDRYYGAQSARSLIHFDIGHDKIPIEVVHAFAVLKKACALVNQDLGKLKPEVADLIVKAADEVSAGKLDEHFPLGRFKRELGRKGNGILAEAVAGIAAPYHRRHSRFEVSPHRLVSSHKDSRARVGTARHRPPGSASRSKL